MKNKKQGRIITGITILSCITITPAQSQVDENAMFADTSSMVDSAKVVNTQAAKDDAQEKKSLGFSGEIYAYANPSMSRDWFDGAAFSTIGFSSRIVGNGLFDARLAGGAKAFADMEASYTPAPSSVPLQTENMLTSDSGARFTLREFFVDANYRKLVYLRAGKQVLQWGSCSFWNPTDMVNIERKSFLQKEGHREGTYGLKVHIPYKTLFNFYSFIDANDAADLHGVAVSLKAEALFGRTEMALSAWNRAGYKPAFGLDGTTQLFNVQIAAEASLRNGSRKITLEKKGAGWDTSTIGDKWYPRIAVNLTKFFPLAGVADRLTVSGEFYYNHIGYGTNIFNDPALGRDLQGLMTGRISSVDTNDFIKMPWLANPDIVSNLYEMHSYSKYYAALFASISRFILDDMTFSCNAIGNLNQKSFVVSAGVDYQSLHNFVFGISLNAFLGPKNTEYTFTGNGLMVQVRTGIIF
jgi:hypothetical protein